MNQLADWSEFENQWSHWTPSVVVGEAARAFAGRVPNEWLRLVEEPTASSVEAIWAMSGAELPRFRSYLRESILGAAIGEGRYGPVLVYCLRNWLEMGIDRYQDGVMVAGLPTQTDVLDTFSGDVGTLPPSLLALWRVHRFITLKNGDFVVPVRPPEESPLITPRVHLDKQSVSDPADRRDCLAISATTSSLMLCVSRTRGGRHWDDYLVDAERWGLNWSESLRTRVDDLLADWMYQKWAQQER